jgi:hypothetical protein
MSEYCPGAELHLVGNTGAMEGGPARATHHITSNDNDWTFKNELGWFSGGGAGVAPHLLADPFTGQVAQFFPASSRSLSLKNAGDVRTNRTGKYNIQIEWVFTEGETVNGKTYRSLAETPMKPWPQIRDWLKSLGITEVWPGGRPAAFARDTVSLSTWTGMGGHYGHNQVPGNDHVDPGPMPNLFTSTIPPEETVALTNDEIKAIGRQVVTGANGMHDPDDDSLPAAISSYVESIYALTKQNQADIKLIKTKLGI